MAKHSVRHYFQCNYDTGENGDEHILSQKKYLKLAVKLM